MNSAWMCLQTYNRTSSSLMWKTEAVFLTVRIFIWGLATTLAIYLKKKASTQIGSSSPLQHKIDGVSVVQDTAMARDWDRIGKRSIVSHRFHPVALRRLQLSVRIVLSKLWSFSCPSFDAFLTKNKTRSLKKTAAEMSFASQKVPELTRNVEGASW